MQTSEHSNNSAGLGQQKRAAGFGKDSSSKETLTHSIEKGRGTPQTWLSVIGIHLQLAAASRTRIG